VVAADRVLPGQVSVSDLTEAGFRALLERLRRQSDWGQDDRRGALNHITPEAVLAAAGEVRLGRAVSMAASVRYEPMPDNPQPASHEMTGMHEPAPPDATDRPREPVGMAFAADRIAINVHGDADSHIDALCHVSFDGALFNGVPVASVTEAGASELAIEIARDGIVGRGVLLDVPRAREVPWLEPGDHVTDEDIIRSERSQHLQVGEGDLVFVRVGHRRRKAERGPWDAASARAGLHPSALEYLASRRIGVLGSDGNNDTAPSVVAGVDFPVHVLAIVGLGLHLLDYLEFAELAPLCAEAGRWSFLCVIAPLRLSMATGSPVNPIAIL
jgi:kynurenine formamidase